MPDNTPTEDLVPLLTSASLSHSASVAGVSAICAKLLSKGIFDADDIRGIFNVMEKSVARVAGAEEQANANAASIRLQRDTLLAGVSG